MATHWTNDYTPITYETHPIKVTAQPYYGRNPSGYGRKMPLDVKVFYLGRWRRIYCCQFSNVGTCYIVCGGKDMIVSDIDRENLTAELKVKEGGFFNTFDKNFEGILKDGRRSPEDMAATLYGWHNEEHSFEEILKMVKEKLCKNS